MPFAKCLSVVIASIIGLAGCAVDIMNVKDAPELQTSAELYRTIACDCCSIDESSSA